MPDFEVAQLKGLPADQLKIKAGANEITVPQPYLPSPHSSWIKLQLHRDSIRNGNVYSTNLEWGDYSNHENKEGRGP